MFFQMVIQEIADFVEDQDNWRARFWLIASILMLLIGNVLFMLTFASAVEQQFLPAAAFFVASAIAVLSAGLSLARGFWIIAKDKGFTIPTQAKWWACALLAVVVVVPAPILLAAFITVGILVWRRKTLKSGVLPG